MGRCMHTPRGGHRPPSVDRATVLRSGPPRHRKGPPRSPTLDARATGASNPSKGTVMVQIFIHLRPARPRISVVNTRSASPSAIDGTGTQTRPLRRVGLIQWINRVRMSCTCAGEQAPNSSPRPTPCRSGIEACFSTCPGNQECAVPAGRSSGVISPPGCNLAEPRVAQSGSDQPHARRDWSGRQILGAQRMVIFQPAGGAGVIVIPKSSQT